MTDSEWQILDLSGRWIDATSKEAAIGCIKDGTATATALRRLASSDGGVKGEPEPVAWRWRYDSEYTWSLRKDRPIHADDRDVICEPLYTAPPADAGMREALQEAYIAGAIAVHNEWLAAFERGEGPPRGDPDFSEAASDYAALTAPGATTKSDGGAKAGSSPILASKEDQRSDTHGMMPVGDNAANVGSTGVGPSDPSSTRSEVTVDELVEWCKRNQFFPSWDKARALLDQFEIRRKG